MYRHIGIGVCAVSVAVGNVFMIENHYFMGFISSHIHEICHIPTLVGFVFFVFLTPLLPPPLNSQLQNATIRWTIFKLLFGRCSLSHKRNFDQKLFKRFIWAERKKKRLFNLFAFLFATWQTQADKWFT